MTAGSGTASVHEGASEGVEVRVEVIGRMYLGSGSKTMSVRGGEAFSGSSCSSVSEGANLYWNFEVGGGHEDKNEEGIRGSEDETRCESTVVLKTGGGARPEKHVGSQRLRGASRTSVSFEPDAWSTPPRAATSGKTAGGPGAGAEAGNAPASPSWGAERSVAAAEGEAPLALAEPPTRFPWWGGVTSTVAPAGHALGITGAPRSRVSPRAGTEVGAGTYSASWDSTGATAARASERQVWKEVAKHSPPASSPAGRICVSMDTIPDVSQAKISEIAWRTGSGDEDDG